MPVVSLPGRFLSSIPRNGGSANLRATAVCRVDVREGMAPGHARGLELEGVVPRGWRAARNNPC